MAIGRRPSSLVSPKFAERQRQARIRRTIVVCVSIIIIISSIIFNANLSIFQIKSIHLEGNFVTPSGDIISLVEEKLSGKYLWSIPRSNDLVYPKDEILEAISQKWLRISDVSAHIEGEWRGLPELHISMTERKMAHLWCEDGESDAGEVCYAADGNGYIFDLAPEFSGNAFLKFYGRRNFSTTTAAAIGETLLSKEQLEKTLELVSGLKEVPMDPETVTAVGNTADEFSVEIKGGGKVFFVLKHDVRQMLENLKSVFKSNTIDLEKLEYVDLRFNNKVYYKMR
jgi:hypothetical protein